MQDTMAKISLDLQNLQAKSENFIVDTPEKQEECIVRLTEIKARNNRLKELQEELTSNLKKEIKRLDGLFKAPKEALASLEAQYKASLKIYMDAEAQRAEEAMAKLRKEQEERARIQKEEADRIRKEAEEKAEAEQKRIAEAMEQANAKERAKLEAEKAKAEEELKEAQVKAIVAEQALDVAPIEAPKSSVRSSEGTLATRKLSWTYQVTDIDALRNARPDLFILDEKKLRLLVIDGLRDLEGVRIYQESEISIRL